MNVFAIGTEKNLQFLQSKIGVLHAVENIYDAQSQGGKGDVLFHFWEDESPDDLDGLDELEGWTVFINTLKTTLIETTLFVGEPPSEIYGFTGNIGFLDASSWDISNLESQSFASAEKVLTQFGLKAVEVKDRVGMVTPRVICMIINEAFYTVMEGTSQKADIDLAMKLGTNYPGGPFEWLEKIGIEEVYDILEAMYEDTKEERYKICPLLKSEYLTSIRTAL